MYETRHNFSVFIDADVALLQRSPEPPTVSVAPYVLELLDKLHRHFEGALALLSSTDIATLDERFAPHAFAAAGLYGCELRLADRIISTPSFSSHTLDALQEECARFADESLGVLVERRTCSIALHYFSAATEMHVWEFLYQILASFGDCFSLRHRQGCYEIIPSGYVMTRAITEFMQSATFVDRIPIFIGGGVMSELAFEAVNYLGGSTIRVGRGGYTCAKQSVPTALAVHRLLAGLIDEFDWLVLRLSGNTAQPSGQSEPYAPVARWAGQP